MWCCAGGAPVESVYLVGWEGQQWGVVVVGEAAMGSGGGGRGSNGEWWWWEGQQWEVVVVGGAAMGDGGRGSNGMAENGCALQKG